MERQKEVKRLSGVALKVRPPLLVTQQQALLGELFNVKELRKCLKH